MRLLNKAAVVGSGVLMIHATICAIQHRTYLKAVQQPFEYPPLEITVQCILALALGMWGMIGLAGNFVPIRTTTHLSKQFRAAPTHLSAPR